MMDGIANFIRSEIASALKDRMHSSTMVATSYNPELHAIKGVKVPEEVETGWMPIAAPMAGVGFGIVVGPDVGTADKLDGTVFHVSHEAGDPNSPMAHGRIHNNVDKPPVAKSGEVVVAGKWGGGVKLADDKTVTISGTGGSTTVHNADGSITHTDSAGGVIHMAGGKVYLGSKTASIRMMTEAGPSNHIYGIV